eukprot:CAMPEP_0118937124 /NCGR_PEP_ID=MMETSP1169-20130426/21698_1 /TAXON_ID=36882 /ORGANISM="Pyramimonas obovata, Strain CCMP722" /LENGTH=45 /DNA_ID= /DNA_START= /DNA_END= /DNA_ORIENTATION=
MSFGRAERRGLCRPRAAAPPSSLGVALTGQACERQIERRTPHCWT